MQKVQTLQEQESFTIRGPQLEVLGEVESKLPAPMKKRSSAALTAVALALAATFGIGGIKLSSRCAAVQAQYAAVVDKYGNSLVQDLDLAADYAANVIRVGENVLGSENYAVIAAKEALEAWNETSLEHPAEQYTANLKLATTVKSLYDEAYGEIGAGKIESQYTQFESQQMIISYEAAAYNEEAISYNAMANSFFTNLIANLWGADQVELFR